MQSYSESEAIFIFRGLQQYFSSILSSHTLESSLLAVLLRRLPMEEKMFEDIGLHQENEGLGGPSYRIQPVGLG